jgi:hypothetical protein
MVGRMAMRVLLACFIASVTTGCFAPAGSDDDTGPGPTSCNPEPTYEIDTSASITHTAGVDAGYYAEYDGAGAWHFEWTCDTDLSSEGCTFSGSIVAPTPASGDVGATCYECEADDQLSTQPASTSGDTEIDFNTDTSTGIDGVDFTTTPGASIEIDFQINALYQNDLVFLPSGGETSNPTCMPAYLAPSTP